MGCAAAKELSPERMIEGLKSLLETAAGQTVNQLGAAGGFSGGALRITIPGTLGEVMGKAREMPGIGGKVDDFENKMNDAAEAASAACLDIFKAAIASLNFQNAKEILQGASDSATQFFRTALYDDVLARFVPIVHEKMNELGVVSIFTSITEAYENIPFIGKKVEFNIYEYVVDKAYTGFFATLGDWEKSVRTMPEFHTSDALKDCFGGKK